MPLITSPPSDPTQNRHQQPLPKLGRRLKKSRTVNESVPDGITTNPKLRSSAKSLNHHKVGRYGYSTYLQDVVNDSKIC